MVVRFSLPLSDTKASLIRFTRPTISHQPTHPPILHQSGPCQFLPDLILVARCSPIRACQPEHSHGSIEWGPLRHIPLIASGSRDLAVRQVGTSLLISSTTKKEIKSKTFCPP